MVVKRYKTMTSATKERLMKKYKVGNIYDLQKATKFYAKSIYDDQAKKDLRIVNSHVKSFQHRKDKTKR